MPKHVEGPSWCCVIMTVSCVYQRATSAKEHVYKRAASTTRELRLPKSMQLCYTTYKFQVSEAYYFSTVILSVLVLQAMTLRLYHYPRKNTDKQTYWSSGLNYMLNHGLITGFESVQYSPIGRVLSRFETSSTAKFHFIHAPQYAYHMVKNQLISLKLLEVLCSNFITRLVLTLVFISYRRSSSNSKGTAIRSC